MHVSTLVGSILAASLLAVAGCDDGITKVDPDLIDPGPARRTYAQDLKPVVDAKCVGCHNQAGIAPFSLETFADVHDSAEQLLHMVESGLMPPWPPSAACNDYVGDRSLSAEQKQLFRTWIEDGKLEGDPARPAPPLSVEKVELSRVDLDLAIEQPYVPRTTAFQPDDYRCFVIPWPETATTHVTGFRAVPGNPKVVHHVIAFLATPAEVATYQKLDADEEGLGYTCFGGSGGPARKWLGGWAPGTLGQDAPPGTGLRVEPGSVVILQVHYNVLEAGVQPDQTTVQFKLDDAVDKEAEIVPWANPRWPGTQSMRIAAGDRDATHSFQYDASVVTGGAFTVYSSSLHMHTLGSHATASIERAGGGSDCLLQIDDWNFHWQGNYDLRQPVQFQPGDQLKIECHWDNSPENQPLMNGELRAPADVFWGEGTTDEMCLGVFYVTTP